MVKINRSVHIAGSPVSQKVGQNLKVHKFYFSSFHLAFTMHRSESLAPLEKTDSNSGHRVLVVTQWK